MNSLLEQCLQALIRGDNREARRVLKIYLERKLDEAEIRIN